MPKPNNENANKGQYGKYSEYLEYSIRGNKAIGNRVKELKELQKGLRELNKLIDGLYRKDDSGNYKPISKEQLNLLKQSYKKCDYYASRAEKNVSGKKMTGTLLSQLHKVLKEDEEYVHCLKVGDTFPEKFRRNIVKMNSADFEKNKVGDKISTRHPITYRDENGKQVSGFFTQSVSITVPDEKRKKFKTNYSGLADRINRNPNDVDAQAKKRTMDEYLAGHPEMILALAGLNAKIESQSNISDRNCAMTRIANLLGVGSVLADSHSMTIVDEKNGKNIEGVFMSTSEGTTYENLLLKQEYKEAIEAVTVETQYLLQGKDLSQIKDPVKCIDLTSGKLKKDIADMQILDFICGNVDRHEGNITYVFDPDNPSRMIGVQGIDNDQSMGCLNLKTNEGYDKLPALDSMLVISESVANKVKEMTEQNLAFALKGLQLSENEVKSAWNRVKQVQQFLEKASRYEQNANLGKNKFTIVPDDKFSEINFGDFCMSGTGKKNYFNGVSNLPYALRHSKDDDLKKEQDYKKALKNDKKVAKPKLELNDKQTKISYTSAELTRLSFTEEVRNKNQRTVSEIIDKLVLEANNHLEKRKKTYNNIYDAATAINNWYQNYQEGKTDKNELKNLFQRAADECQEYISKHNPRTPSGKRRLRVMTEMVEFIGTQGIMLDDYYEYVSGRIEQANQRRNYQRDDLNISTSHSMNDSGRISFH